MYKSTILRSFIKLRPFSRISRQYLLVSCMRPRSYHITMSLENIMKDSEETRSDMERNEDQRLNKGIRYSIGKELEMSVDGKDDIKHTSEQLDDSITSVKATFDKVTDFLKQHTDNFAVCDSTKYGYVQLQYKSKDDSVFLDTNKLYAKANIKIQDQYKLEMRLPTVLNKALLKHTIEIRSKGGSIFEAYNLYLKSNHALEKEQDTLLYFMVASLCMGRTYHSFHSTLAVELHDAIKTSHFKLAKSIIVNLISVGRIDWRPFIKFLRSQNSQGKDQIHNEITDEIVESLEQHIRNPAPLDSMRQKFKLLAIAAFVDALENHETIAEKRNFLMNVLIHIVTIGDKLLLATSWCLESIKGVEKFTVSKKTINTLIDALLIVNVKYDLYYIDAVVKLCKAYDLPLTAQQAVKLYIKALDAETYDSTTQEITPASIPVMCNTIYQFIVENIQLKGNNQFEKLLEQRKQKNVYSDETMLTIESWKEMQTTNLAGFIRHTSDLLEYNCAMNNAAAVYIIWANFCSLHLDVKLVRRSAIVYSLNVLRKSRNFRQAAIDLAMSLPTELLTEKKISKAILNIASNTKDVRLAKIVLKNTSFLQERYLLGAFLRFYLRIDDEKSANKVLQLILESKEGIFHDEFNEVILSLLKRGLHQKAYELITKNPLKIARSAYITYIDNMVNYDKVNLDIVEEFVLKLYQHQEKELPITNDRRQLYYLSTIYLKYLIKHYDLETVKNIYLNSVLTHDSDINTKKVPGIFKTAYAEINGTLSLSEKFVVNLGSDVPDEFSENFMTIPFNQPEEVVSRLRLYLPNKSKVIALKSLADAAVKSGNGSVFRWSLFELLKFGLSSLEILVDFSKRYATELRKVGFDVPVIDYSDPLQTIGLFTESNKLKGKSKKLAKYNTPEKQKEYVLLQKDSYLILKRYWQIESLKHVRDIIKSYDL